MLVILIIIRILSISIDIKINDKCQNLKILKNDQIFAISTKHKYKARIKCMYTCISRKQEKYIGFLNLLFFNRHEKHSLTMYTTNSRKKDLESWKHLIRVTFTFE